MSSRSAVAKIDWPRLATALSLTPSTTSALTNFRKRNVDSHTKFNHLKTSRTEIDFSYYRSTLKNTAVIDQIEKAAKEFKPVTYDVGVILKGIEGFESAAVKNAQETEKKISEQLADLDETIRNIEQARAPDDLSLDDLHKAIPDLHKKTERMVQAGIWMPPGYREKFGDLTIM